jgi:hypothetical protein
MVVPINSFAIEYTLAVYFAIALPLCIIPTVLTRNPLFFGALGSLVAMVIVTMLRHWLPFEFWAHARLLIIEPFMLGGWQHDLIEALQSIAIHIGVPLLLCFSVDHWLDRRTAKPSF